MTATPPLTPVAAIDVWKAVFFPTNADGSIATPGYPIAATEPYTGILLDKMKSIAPNLGSPRQIPVVSQGSTQTTFLLPSIDPQTLEAHLAYADIEAYAELSGVKALTVGGARVAMIGTNKVGFEKKGILIVSSLAAHEADNDSDVCYFYIFSSVKATFQWAAMNENPIDVTVNFSVGKKKKTPWNAALTETTHGATTAVGSAGVSFGQIQLVAWEADGAEDTFVLPDDIQAASTFADTFKVFDMTDGSAVAGTPAAAQFVASSPPTTAHVLLGWYESAFGL